MKRLLLILILTLSFETLAKADEINEISIEGISVGESALKYFSKKDIKNKKFSIFDMRNIYSPNKMKDQKIRYYSIGN